MDVVRRAAAFAWVISNAAVFAKLHRLKQIFNARLHKVNISIRGI